GLYEDILSILEYTREKSYNNLSIYDINKLASRAEDINSKFLALPDSMPKRVRDLAFEITSDFDNDYDKVRAIELFLNKNYPYTLNPGPTPRGRDFADY